MTETDSNILYDFINKLNRRGDPQFDWVPTAPEPVAPYQRRLTPCSPPVIKPPSGTVEEARTEMRSAIADYLAQDYPTTMLLIKAMPGTGKTTAAVEAIDEIVKSGRRIQYAGPRHDFFQEVTEKSQRPEDWYEWLPRQDGDDESTPPKKQTCLYPNQISTWMQKGYDAIDFCKGVCGWDYIGTGCPWHAQKKVQHPVIFTQHQHITLGHPLDFNVLFGDESPLTAFLHEWKIPAESIMPGGMDYSEPLAEMLHRLRVIAESITKPMQGPELIDFLGGAEEVIDAVSTFRIPTGALLEAGHIRYADEADEKDYFHLPALAQLLDREARLHLEGNDYPHRVVLAAGKLSLMLRRSVDPEKLPPWVIWLDATGQPEIYERLFKRTVEVVDAAPRLKGRIYQVVDRANGKSTLIDRKTRQPSKKAAQSFELINRIIDDREYSQPAVITFKALVGETELDTAHFYAARGSNTLEASDALFVLGAPQPAIYDLVRAAKMIYHERDEAFRVQWLTRERPYRFVADDGLGRQYPVTGFWNDPDLQLILEAMREDEILQAAHRARPVNHACDIWMLTNIPVDALPPDELRTMRSLMKAPEGVNTFSWAQIQMLIDNQEVITLKDIEALGLSEKTARKYFKMLKDLGWEEAVKKPRGRGRPTKTLLPPGSGSPYL